MWLQWVTKGYEGIQGVKMGYRGFQRVTGGYRGLRGATGGYKGLMYLHSAELNVVAVTENVNTFLLV